MEKVDFCRLTKAVADAVECEAAVFAKCTPEGQVVVYNFGSAERRLLCYKAVATVVERGLGAYNGSFSLKGGSDEI